MIRQELKFLALAGLACLCVLAAAAIYAGVIR